MTAGGVRRTESPSRPFEGGRDRHSRCKPHCGTATTEPRGEGMPSNSVASYKPVRRIAIVGTGLIGASWAAEYLAHGFDVVATDPGPNAEANLHRDVAEAWKQLTVIGLPPERSVNHR